MRRHPRAASAGSITGGAAAAARSWRSVVLTALACLATLLLFAASASAATVTQRPLLFSFSGTADAGPLKGPRSLAIDYQTGNVYVADSFESNPQSYFVSKFDSNGVPLDFAAIGSSSLQGTFSSGLGIAVDNSGGAEQGRLLLTEFGDAIMQSYTSGGELQWTQKDTFGQPEDVAVDVTGHPWTDRGRQYANTGSPPAPIGSIGATGSRVGVDANDNVYLFATGQAPRKYVGGVLSGTLSGPAFDISTDQSSPTGHIFTVTAGRAETQKFQVKATAGQFRLSFGGHQTPDLAYNATREQIEAAFEALPSVGAGNTTIFQLGAESDRHYDIGFEGFLAPADLEQVECVNGTTPLSGGTGCSFSTVTQGEASSFREYDAGGTLLNTFGTEYVGVGKAIGYNPTLDRVYVGEGGPIPGAFATIAPTSVSVFGPVQTGTVADLTIDPPASIGVSTAKFSGTVNPQGTSSEWRFEWRKPGQGWASGGSSPFQSLPADSSNHAVEYTTNALRGNTTYQVRLVAVNTANELVGVSSIQLLTTAKATEKPVVTINNPSSVTATTAKISGTINPKGDTAEWVVETSTDPACATGFTQKAVQQLSVGGNSPVAVETEVTGLLPSEHYCARIKATNSAGSTTSTSKEFETLEAQPSQVFTGYAAPRTDTTARLNGFVNSEGAVATYRFEYSADGSTWSTLPDQQTGQLRRQVVVASELTGLQPDTTYHYRFQVETDAGLVQGAEKTFRTRTTAELQLPQRGIELVSPPDKGNQNLAYGDATSRQSLVRFDGEQVVWNVNAGAPGANIGSGASFLASRTPTGWVSKSLVPPADRQIGNGEWLYSLNGMTPSFSHFVLRANLHGFDQEEPATIVRVDTNQNQDTLETFETFYNNNSVYGNTDITDDAAHVLMVNPDNRQLEEIGSTPELISVMPDGTPNECGLEIEGQSFTGIGTGGGGAAGMYQGGYHRMATTDASRVYFQAIPNGGVCVSGDAPSNRFAIYYRDRNTGQTTEIAPPAPAGTTEPKLIRATPDGRTIFFFTHSPLAPGDFGKGGDVYRWDADTENYTCLTCVVSNAEVEGTSDILVSDDFSHIYFMSEEQLVPGYGSPNEPGDGTKLYVLHDEEVKFIADLGSSGSLVQVELSKDGNVLTFLPFGEFRELTADRLAAKCPQELGEGEVGLFPCDEIFRYEASTESLECISCRPSGTTVHSVGSPGLSSPFALSGNGSTLALVTRERLLPEDINGSEDVYQWRNGKLGLISDGETVYPTSGITTAPKVYGIDESGDNIFFSLVDPDLTGYEQEGTSNLYDARIGGGFPRPTPAIHCSEESCQGPLQPAPAQQSSGSAAFTGPGNPAPITKRKGRCAGKKGKARRRCLQKQKRRAQRSRRALAIANAGGAK